MDKDLVKRLNDIENIIVGLELKQDESSKEILDKLNNILERLVKLESELK